MSKGTQTGGWGGAVLQLESADTSAAVCSTGVKQLAAWLGSRQTWLGFNFTEVRLWVQQLAGIQAAQNLLIPGAQAIDLYILQLLFSSVMVWDIHGVQLSTAVLARQLCT
jgi:hypothetical protein